MLISQPAGLEDDASARCPNGDVDSRWGISWLATPAGGRDSQPCPVVGNGTSSGFAFRTCGADGDWEEEVDVMNCRDSRFLQLDEAAVRMRAKTAWRV